MSVLSLCIGLLLFIAGILFFMYNRRITLGYMNILNKITRFKVFKSKSLSFYVRLRFYLAGIVCIVLGLFSIIGSV